MSELVWLAAPAVTSSAHDAIPQLKHSALAWFCALAVTVSSVSGYFNYEIVSLAAAAFGAIAALAWIVRVWARRLARTLPATANPGIATLQAGAWLCLIALWLWTASNLVPLFIFAYPEPAMNRAYAESQGIELGPLLFAALGACVALTFAAIAVIRALRNPAPGASAVLRGFCLAAPLACLFLAMAPYSYFPGWTTAWADRGADLPDSILFFRAAEGYWGILPGFAIAISILAWASRSRAAVFSRSVSAQLFLLMLCGALLSLAATSAWLPLFSMCASV